MTAHNPQELAAFLESLEDYVPTVQEKHIHYVTLRLSESVNKAFAVGCSKSNQLNVHLRRKGQMLLADPRRIDSTLHEALRV